MALTPRPIITKELILNQIDSLEIFQQYCNNFQKIGVHFNSELRNDKNASCIIDWINGDLMYSDFGDIKGVRAIDYVILKYNLTFTQALEEIYYKFKLNEKRNSRSLYLVTSSINSSWGHRNTPTGANKENKPTTIRIKRRIDSKGNYTFRKTDLQYWEEFYWTKEMLKLSKTSAISHYFINSRRTDYETRTFNVGNDRVFSYDYYEHNGVMRRKLYFPDKKDFRWISNVDDSIVQLSQVAPKKGDILFITSSQKDAGIFWRINIERYFPDLIIHGVAPNNEGSFVPEQWYFKMKQRWKRIIIWYDNDWDKEYNTGIENAKKYSEKYGIEYFYNPDNTPKDPSDFSKEKTLNNFVDLIKIILKRF